MKFPIQVSESGVADSGSAFVPHRIRAYKGAGSTGSEFLFPRKSSELRCPRRRIPSCRREG
jgi:hypothetical protein